MLSGIFMQAVNYSTARNSLKKYCDEANKGETYIITRKNKKDVVLMSLDQYNELQKASNNIKYIIKLQKSLDDIRNKRVVIKSLYELKK